MYRSSFFHHIEHNINTTCRVTRIGQIIKQQRRQYRPLSDSKLKFEEHYTVLCLVATDDGCRLKTGCNLTPCYPNTSVFSSGIISINQSVTSSATFKCNSQQTAAKRQVKRNYVVEMCVENEIEGDV